MANYTMSDLKQIGALEGFLETRACELAIKMGREVSAGLFDPTSLDEFRHVMADYQAVKSISDVAAGRSEEWALRERARTEIRREKLAARHHDWIENLHQAVRGSERDVDLLRLLANIAMEIADAVSSFEAGAAEVEARIAHGLTELRKTLR